MRHYYYDLQNDLGAVIHMFVNQGICFTGYNELHQILYGYKIGRSKIYVATESEHILERIFNDVCVDKNGKIIWLGTQTEINDAHFHDKPVIIFRNNKHFFMPKLEETS